MQLTCPQLKDQQFLPDEFAAGIPDAQQHAKLGPNRNPPLTWRDLPSGTKSLVLLCVDGDVPSRMDDVNQEGRSIPADLPRIDFYHWVLVDLAPAAAGTIGAGEFSEGFIAKGKPGPQGPRGTRQGINNYREWFAGNPDMGGNYFGYDGPFPPWNDSIIHRYVFTLYALDVERCAVEGNFTGPDVLKAIEGHVLDSAQLTLRYSLTPELRRAASV